MAIVVAIVGGVIDEPFALNQVQFRCPDIIRVLAPNRRSPDAHTRVLADPGDGPGTADEDPPIAPALRVIIKAAVEDHPRVGRMRWQNRVNSVARLLVKLSIKRALPNQRPFR